MSRLLLAFRLAWRDIQLHKSRTAFAVVLFALPLLAFLSLMDIPSAPANYVPPQGPTSTVSFSDSPCPDADSLADLSELDCIPPADLERVSTSPDMERITAALGNDSELASTFLPEITFTARLRGPSEATAFGTIDAVQAAARTDTSAIPQPGEILLDDSEAFAISAHVGDTVAVRYGEREVSLRVAGVAAQTTTINFGDVPLQLPDNNALVSAELRLNHSLEWVSKETVPRHPNAQGVSFITTTTRPPVTATNALEDLFGSVTSWKDAISILSICTLLLLFIACLTGPVFAVSARRKLTTLGLLSATGAKPADLFGIMLAEGCTVGGLGGALGILASVIWNAAAGNLVWPWDLSVIVFTIAVVCGIGSALIPAVQASRLDPVQALQEGMSIRIRRLRAHHVIAPVVTLVAGWLSMYDTIVPSEMWLVVAAIAAIFGTTTLVLLVARVGSYLPVPLRMATRDAVRNYHRTVPAVAAVTGVILIITLFNMVITSRVHIDDEAPARNRAIDFIAKTPTDSSTPYQNFIAEFEAKYNMTLRTDSYRAHRIDSPNTAPVYLPIPENVGSGTFTESPAVDFNVLAGPASSDVSSAVFIMDANAPQLLAKLYPGALSNEQVDQAVRALEDGKIVTNFGGVLRDGKARIVIPDPHDQPPGSTVIDGYRVYATNSSKHTITDIPGVMLGNNDHRPPEVQLIITPQTLETLNLQAAYTNTCLARDRDLGFVESLRLSLEDFSEKPFSLREVVPDSNNVEDFAFAAIPLSGAVALTLSVVLLVILLAQAESRRDVETMVALGASQRMLRHYAGAQGLMIGLLGTLAGSGYALYLLELSTSSGQSWHGVTLTPWLFLGATLTLVPLLSWITGLVFGARLHSSPAHVHDVPTSATPTRRHL